MGGRSHILGSSFFGGKDEPAASDRLSSQRGEYREVHVREVLNLHGRTGGPSRTRGNCGNDVYLLDLRSGRSVVVAQPKATRLDAQLEPDGLYVAARNTLTFTPRAQVEQRFRRPLGI